MNSPTGSTEPRRQRHAGRALSLIAVAVLGLAAWWGLEPSLTIGAAQGVSARSAPCPAQAAGIDWTRGEDLVWVPGGAYTMGDTRYPEEKPRSTQVAGFWMDRTEVTNAQFAAFVQATGYQTVAERPVDASRHAGLPPELRQPGALVFAPPANAREATHPSQWWRYQAGASWRHPDGPDSNLTGRERWPVVAVTREDAQAYARWLGRELPTEAQWEWAARQSTLIATTSTTANTWQGPFPVRDTAEDGHAGRAPVGCYPPNALGLYDLIGNVWELVQDDFEAGFTVIKGGSYLCSDDYCMRARPGARQPQELDLGSSHIGFRTILKTRETEAHEFSRDRQGRTAPQIPRGTQQAPATGGQ
ncbi:MAG: SUMF1/EgtB/PvdO family nonheme iron enzyme [Burkholderiaceae bacterium]